MGACVGWEWTQAVAQCPPRPGEAFDRPDFGEVEAMRGRRILAACGAAALWLATLGLGAGTAAAATPTVSTAQNAKLGQLLVGPSGMTLYYFKKDTKGVSNCSGACAQLWPPLTVTGTPTAGSGVSGTLGTIKRTDGTTQVTYNGWPLYHFASDKKPGDTNGQGVKGIWFVAPPTLTAAVAAAAPALPKTGGGPLPQAAGVLLLGAGALLLLRRRRAA